jgi:cell division protein FtsL
VVICILLATHSVLLVTFTCRKAIHDRQVLLTQRDKAKKQVHMEKVLSKFKNDMQIEAMQVE